MSSQQYSWILPESFNNVHHERLIHNMRKRKIPAEITQWILSFLNNRITQMRFNGIITDPHINPHRHPPRITIITNIIYPVQQ